MSAAIVWTVGLALLVDTVGHDTIGQAMGYVSLSLSFAVLLGPLLGGVVYARAGYFGVYYMAFALIALDIIFRIILIERKTAEQWVSPPSTAPSSACSHLSMPSETGKPPATPTNTVVRYSQSPAQSAASPPIHAQRPKKALPPVLTLLSSRRLLAALYATLTQSSLLTAWDAVLPLYTNRLFGWSSVSAPSEDQLCRQAYWFLQSN